MRWISLCRGRLRYIQHVVDRNDADEHAGRVSDRQRTAVVLAEHGDRCFLIVTGLQGHEASIHEISDAVVHGASRNSRMRTSSINAPCSSTT